jgi:hypothetical protein
LNRAALHLRGWRFLAVARPGVDIASRPRRRALVAVELEAQRADLRQRPTMPGPTAGSQRRKGSRLLSRRSGATSPEDRGPLHAGPPHAATLPPASRCPSAPPWRKGGGPRHISINSSGRGRARSYEEAGAAGAEADGERPCRAGGGAAVPEVRTAAGVHRARRHRGGGPDSGRGGGAAGQAGEAGVPGLRGRAGARACREQGGGGREAGEPAGGAAGGSITSDRSGARGRSCSAPRINAWYCPRWAGRWRGRRPRQEVHPTEAKFEGGARPSPGSGGLIPRRKVPSAPTRSM